MFFLDSALDSITVVRKLKGSPATIWAASSLFLFIDTFVYSLTVANLPDILQDKMHTSESANGVMTAMFGVGAIVGATIVMLFSDRHSLRRPFQLLGAVFYIVAGVVFYYAEHFYQMILFRLVNGIASGVACTLLYTAVGDVYPANLLGFKVAIIYFSNNISYTIGPICGEKLFDTSGIPAIASVVIALGVLEFVLVFTIVEDSLILRELLQYSTQKPPEYPGSSASDDDVPLHTLNADIKDTHRNSEAPFAQSANVNSMTTVSEECQPHEQPHTAPTMASLSNDTSPQNMTVWRLFFHIHVLVPTISIIVSIGIQCMLEGVVPLHLNDAFDESSRSGITFVVYGLALTVLVPVIGKVNDVIIERYGDQMRYYLMLIGSLSSILTITLMALAKSYGVMIFGYVLYAITNLCMCIPAQSAYGDFANYLDSNSMARSYGIGTIAWALGAIAFPPIDSMLKIPPILQAIRSRPSTIWATSSIIALVNRLVYTLTIACLPDFLQNTLHVSRANNGVVTTAFGIGGLIGGLCIGYISDRTRNRLIPQASAALLYIVSGCILYFASSFYQVVIFRIVLGIASSTADTMLFTTVADVYPANLLGLKMSILFVFDNVGNMLGPWLGGKAYEKMGIQGISIISMGLGAAEFAMILVFVQNSLDIRKALSQLVSPQTEIRHKPVPESAIESNCSSSNSLGESNFSQGFSQSHSICSLETGSTKGNPCIAMSTRSVERTNKTKTHKETACTHIWKLVLKLPVIGPAVTIFVATGMQSVVETTIPLRLYDKFGYSPETIGIAFLIVGGVLIVAMPLVGYINDTIIVKYGENMRYYAIALGAMTMFLSLLLTGVASTYTVLIFGYALFAITAMVAIVPAQSAFGDFINSSESEAMAQCYSLAWIAEGLANISLPPLASGLYAAVGFLSMLIKSTSLKPGLNLRKPKPSINGPSKIFKETTQSQRASVFLDSNDDILEEEAAETVTTKPIFSGGSQSRESAKLAKELEETNPSVYEYDEVYDSISAARSRINEVRKKKDNSKPKYMEKLLETAKRRQMQQEVVKERILEKERQREGDMYANKETFVTSAYKELKDQRQQLVKEEERQEEEDDCKSAANSKAKQLFGASAGFYREFLDQVDRDDVSKAATSLDIGDKGFSIPEDQFATAKTDSLGAGLNLVSKRVLQRKSANIEPRTAIRDSSLDQERASKHKPTGQERTARRLYQHGDNGLQEHERNKIESSIQERKEMIRKYARRNDDAAIEAARQRYFLRVSSKAQQAS
ncbi:hypothetical protein IW140_004521 [Coemansia sp. RSA 1813]|nr:hypothetical protein IW140_004521 [Coemansia sp. RSA 1813]